MRWLLIITLMPLGSSSFFLEKVSAQNSIGLPNGGSMITLRAPTQPPRMMGINLYAHNPLKFDFIIDKGDSQIKDKKFTEESKKLIKYFLTSLTIPEDEMWVNLSPYEPNKIIPQAFGKTQMGQDVLTLDYMLKQLTSYLMHPNRQLGSQFWDRIYKKTQEQFGTEEIPLNTFNKIWIVPEEAHIYEHSQGAFIIHTHLKVMLEEDYLALEANQNSTKHGLGDTTKNDIDIISGISKEITREILIPEIEKEINEGKTFANLRQIYHSMLLASWYKKALKSSFLTEIYIDKKKTGGIEGLDENRNKQIYNQYLKTFKNGVFNIIKEDYDPALEEIIPKKYFSGGIILTEDYAMSSEDDTKRTHAPSPDYDGMVNLTVGLNAEGSLNDQNPELTFAEAKKMGIAANITEEETDITSYKFHEWYTPRNFSFRRQYGRLEKLKEKIREEQKRYLKELGNNKDPITKIQEFLKSSVKNNDKTLLEIGSGDTGVAMAIATQNPDMKIITTDEWNTNPHTAHAEYLPSAEKFQQGTLAAQTSQLNNIVALRAYANILFYLPDASLDHILLVNPSLGAIKDLIVLIKEFQLADKLKPNGQIIIKANDITQYLGLINEQIYFQEASGYEIFNVDLHQTSQQWNMDILKRKVYIGAKAILRRRSELTPSEKTQLTNLMLQRARGELSPRNYYLNLQKSINPYAKVITDLGLEHGEKAIETILELGEEFLSLLVEPGIATRAEKFVTFAKNTIRRDATKIGKKLFSFDDVQEIRDLFEKRLGKSTVYRSLRLDPDVVKNMQETGIRGLPLDENMSSPKIDILSKYFERGLRGDVLSKAADQRTEEDHSNEAGRFVLSVTPIEQLAKDVAMKRKLYDEKTYNQEAYLFKINIPKIYLIEYNEDFFPLRTKQEMEAMPLTSPYDYRFKLSDGQEFWAHNPAVESFVEISIDQKWIVPNDAGHIDKIEETDETFRMVNTTMGRLNSKIEVTSSTTALSAILTSLKGRKIMSVSPSNTKEKIDLGQRLKKEGFDAVVKSLTPLDDLEIIGEIYKPNGDPMSKQTANDLMAQGAKAYSDGVDMVIDSAMVGGIDLNPAIAKMNITQQTGSLQLPRGPRSFRNININGFLPVIIEVLPISNVLEVIGLN